MYIRNIGEIMENKILVLGATGNIGSHIVTLLQNKNANFKAATHQNTSPSMKTVKIDFNDVFTLLDAMKDIDTLFLPLPAHPKMEIWNKNIIEAAKFSNIKHIVRSSAAVAYQADYQFMKSLRRCDDLLIESGIDYTLTLPQFFMQNFSTALLEDYKSSTLYLPAGEGKIGWVDVRDVAAVNVEILLNPHRYNKQKILISGVEALSYAEAVEQMNTVLNLQTRYVAIPRKSAFESMQTQGLDPFFIGVMMDLNDAIADGCTYECSNSIKTITGKNPITLKEFTQEHSDLWLS